MRSDGLRSGLGLWSALFLGLAGVAVAWLCFRAAIVQVLPPTSPLIVRFVPHDLEAVFAKASVSIVRPRARLSPAMLNEVRNAAAGSPLDARPYLFLGQDELARDPGRATAMLEAGQRLDPRQRLIHALLLERYLRSAQYEKAAQQFSVLARLVGSTQQPIANVVAMMSAVPTMRDPVRQTLRTDPQLERSVLTMLAQGDAAPASIFDLASPAAIAGAGEKDGWGPALVARMVAKGQFVAGHRIWQHIYRLSDAQIAAPIFNAGFAKSLASPPFNWTLAAGSLGAADPRGGGLAIDYYGRDSGDLASQLMVLPAGSYRFAFTVDGGKAAAGATLAWVLHCATGSKAELMNAAITATGAHHREVAAITVPASCPAQLLTLSALAGEFPVPINVTIQDPALQPATARQPVGGRP